MAESSLSRFLRSDRGRDRERAPFAAVASSLRAGRPIPHTLRQVADQATTWVNDRRSDVPFLSRYISHLAVLSLTLLIAGLVNVRLAALTTPHPLPIRLEEDEQAVTPSLSTAAAPRAGFLTWAALPHTIIPERPREEIIVYVVQPGDTVTGISERYTLPPDTLLWSNPALENNPDLLSTGQKIVILPMPGVYHTVAPGDTVESLAQRYKVDATAITDHALNNLQPPYKLTAGQKLVIPNGVKPYQPRLVHAYRGPIPTGAAKGTGIFGWPATGRVTQKYWASHRALDIGALWGSPVYTSDSGYVVFAGWDRTGYGNMALIDHGNGFATRYAHLSTILVKSGESVAKGQVIGKVGSTGNSTGAHLHFEVIKGGVPRNPYNYLR